jgi:hypothetical protein
MLARHHARSAAPRLALILAFVAAVSLPLVAAPVAAAAPGDTIWSRQFSTGAKTDAFLDVDRGPGDVYYCAGVARATEETSALVLVKYESDGTKLWSRFYRPPAGDGAAGVAVAVDAHGDVVVAGTAGVAPPASSKGRDVVVVKYAPSGACKWALRYDGAAHKDDYATGLALDGAGTAFVAGATRGVSTGQDYLVLAVTPAGARKWTWVHDGHGGRDCAAAVAVDGGGNCYATGSSQGAGGTTTATTTKLSRTGAPVWLKGLQYGDEGHSWATALRFRNVGGDRRLFLTGTSVGLTSTHDDLLVAAVDADTGAKLHAVIADGDGGDDGGQAVVVDAAGVAYAAGRTESAATHTVHAFVARMDAGGALVWSKPIWLGPGDNEAVFQTVALDPAGNLVCGGYGVQPGTGPEWWVQSFYPTGDERWINYSSGSASGDDICRAVVANASGVFAAGQISRTSSLIDAQLKKIVP